jgi:nucleotide-binding universal stress UspA family protein
MTARPVVVGSDASEASLRAVEWAAREAARRGAPLRIVSVTRAAGSPESSGGPPATPDEALRSLYEQSLRSVAQHAARIAPHLVMETELLSGPPARMLVSDASRASMLVVGAQGMGGYDQPGVGPVSGYVTRHASCPAVVVREPGEAADGRIVVGVRDAGEATAALRFGLEEAALRGVPLLAVHAWYWFPPALLPCSPARWTPAPVDADGTGTAVSAVPRREVLDARAMSAQAAGRLAEVLDGWRGKYPGVRVSQQVIHCHPAHALAELSVDAGLVVLGRHAHRDGLRPGSGLIQHTVLSRAHGHVAVVPST